MGRGQGGAGREARWTREGVGAGQRRSVDSHATPRRILGRRAGREFRVSRDAQERAGQGLGWEAECILETAVSKGSFLELGGAGR